MKWAYESTKINKLKYMRFYSLLQKQVQFMEYVENSMKRFDKSKNLTLYQFMHLFIN